MQPYAFRFLRRGVVLLHFLFAEMGALVARVLFCRTRFLFDPFPFIRIPIAAKESCSHMEKYTRESVLVLLRTKYDALCAAGENRYPRRSDFSAAEVCAVKAYLGPWPRALESAGIKPPRQDDRLARNREKRIRAKRNRRLQGVLLDAANADTAPQAKTENDPHIPATIEQK